LRGARFVAHSDDDFQQQARLGRRRTRRPVLADDLRVTFRLQMPEAGEAVKSIHLDILGQGFRNDRLVG
jgi:hypothetical protein